MASNFQKFMATAEKHAVAGSSKLKATIAGHINCCKRRLYQTGDL